MKTYTVEIITNDTTCATIEIEVTRLTKVNYNHIVVINEDSGEDWVLPSIAGMSFGEVLEVEI